MSEQAPNSTALATALFGLYGLAGLDVAETQYELATDEAAETGRR